MKTLLLLFLSSSICFSQKIKENYITYSNFANEGEYYFHEGQYDTAAYYFGEAFKYSSDQHPNHQKLYAYSLMQTKQGKKAIEILGTLWIEEDFINAKWFPDISEKEKKLILKKRKKLLDLHANIAFYQSFVDSIMEQDQSVRKAIHAIDDTETRRLMMNTQDSSNAEAVIRFTRKYGFPGGQNAGWSQSIGSFILHMSPEWFVENQALLISEVKKGNLEPWMLARGIDRMFAVEIGDEKIAPYNRYWTNSIVNPYLLFMNCIALGVSPYYDFNWSAKPKKTIHFDYYQANKKYFNTTILEQ